MSGLDRHGSPEDGDAGLGDLALGVAETLWLWDRVDPAIAADGGEETSHPKPPGSGPPGQPEADLPPDPDPSHPRTSTARTVRVELSAARHQLPGQADRPRSGTQRYKAEVRAEPAVADPLSFHRALRGLDRQVPSVDRWELDELATAERFAMDELGIPVRRAESEPCYEMHLVVDDSPSMTLWLDMVPGLARLLEQARFRDVRVSYLDTTTQRPEQVLLRATRTGEGAPATSSHVPSGRQIVWIVTDTLAPGWHADAIAPALHRWARSGPVALINLLPERMWRWGGLRTHRVRMVPARGGTAGTAPRWVFSRPWGRALTGVPDLELARALPVPMIELAPEWLAPWAEMVGAEPARPTELPAVLAGPLPRSRPADQHPPSRTARLQLDRFRQLASPVAFELAVHLAAAPLTWPVLRQVLDMVPAAGRRHLSEVLASGVVIPVRRRRDGASSGVTAGAQIALEFADGLREELLAHGDRASALRVLHTAANTLGDDVDAFREIDLVLTSEHPEEVGLPAVTEANRPFLAVEETVLASVAGRFLRRSRRLGALISPLAQGTAAPSTTDSVRGMTMSSDTQSGHAPTPRPDPDVSITPGHRSEPGTQSRGGREFVTSSTATPLVESRRGQTTWPMVLGGAVPQRNPNFTGRADLLRELHRRLGEGATAVLPEALHGMGGVGKSQLAVEYVYRYQAEYELIWWIPAERNAQIAQALVDLAPSLRLEVGGEVNAALPLVREALRTGRPFGRWLLVFDNAEDPSRIVEYFPTAGAEGRVLVTSRDARWASVARPLEVAVFARSESTALLRRRDTTLTEDEADRLAAALGDLPLAVDQAATWRVETGMPVDEYLELLETKTSELFREDEPAEPGRRAEQSVTAAWSVSLDRLAEKNPASLRLLQVCAFLAPEGISRQLFTRARSTMIVPELDAALRDSVALGRAIREVTRYSLMKLDHRTSSFQMHRLVQKVLIDRMPEAERETMRRGAQALLAASDPADPVSRENWPRYGELYPHVLASETVRSSDTWVRELYLNEVRYLYQWGEHQAARALAQDGYDIWSRTLGAEDRHTLDIGGWLSFVLFLIGRFQEAAALNTQLLDICERALGEEHEVTLEALGAVAADKRVEGDFAAALTLSQQVYERSVRTLGPDEPQTLEAAHNVSVTYRLLGRFGAARDLAVETLERREAQLGVDAIPCLISTSGINTDHRELGDYPDARDKQEEVVLRFRQAFGDQGESNPQLLRARRNLAVARRKAGDHQGALEESRDVQTRLATRYNLDYPDALAASLCLSMDLRHTGELAEARDLCEDTLERYRAVLGPKHPHTLAAAVNLAVTHRLGGDITAAHTIDVDALAGLREVLGEQHPSTLVALTNLASDHYALGDAERARELDVDVAEQSTAVLGDSHPATLAAQSNLAMDLRRLGQTREAENLHTETVRRMGQVLGVEHPATRNAASWVRADCDIDPMPL
ncbi:MULTISPECIES: FxSxx-COOH system tetratricopeptide repeat protein [unclassified Parafrankia]|uniref:FxSxx-COOH system tetratricopeptide repeat protein n=1 Tax=unclassified Parafrankia TaxID=2994368 RepID=UPI000DA58366|nr:MULTISPECIES: FxSxx-COOH system tetratricopeptide repeat protein [unclassified Parafrankia]TCJ34213.1 tetratricopeptide repeat protein [Parafrankia sp. BMG5.11]SQE00733.1 NB-ARC domain protein [Parafrankia sp. Ea1.12]